jgi:nucleotide-binding universal stress UspA family protein
MTYAVLLAAACGVDDDRAAIALSAELAQRQSSLVRVLMSLPDPVSAVTSWGPGGAYIAPEVIDELESIRDEQAATIAAVAKTAAANQGLAFGYGDSAPRLIVEPLQTPPWDALARALPLVDLVVMSGEAAKGAGLATGPFAETLMSARTPVLIARGGDLPENGVVAVAWNGGLEAGRAVRAAMPLLREAAKVVILQDPHGLDAAERDAAAPDRLAQYLTLSGVRVVEAVNVLQGRDGFPLAVAAEAAGARLLVAGAYGHARLREWVLGGATRALLESKGGPHLLIAH